MEQATLVKDVIWHVSRRARSRHRRTTGPRVSTYT